MPGIGSLFSILLILCLLPTCSAAADTQPAVAIVPYKPPPSSPRFTVLISDLHFGLGKTADGGWNPTEDFRWPNALQGFLDKISELGEDNTDLVVVGDFLELWQPPADIKCKGVDADLGCSIDEMAELVERVTEQHKSDLAILRNFAQRGENRLHLIVGNHDSTLRYATVWKPLGDALNASSGRVELLENGIWVSDDGRIVAEHGHQIGKDVNRYETWPDIVRAVDGKQYVVRPWGEFFVQKLFNEQEVIYSVIDNLSPETAGARYRMADRGLWGSAADIAKLLAFNLLETSLGQKVVSLGKPPEGIVVWDVTIARNMGASLFLFALSRNDPLRVQLTMAGSEADAIKSQMDALARDPLRLPDEEVRQICDLIALKEPLHICWNRTLGSLAQNILESKSKVIAKHLKARQETYKSMRVFVYGHTHQFEEPWSVKLPGAVEVSVANTGAFQRLISESGFLTRLGKRTPEEALRSMNLNELPPCYTAVLIEAVAPNGIPKPKVHAWLMREDGAGSLVPPGDKRCK